MKYRTFTASKYNAYCPSYSRRRLPALFLQNVAVPSLPPGHDTSPGANEAPSWAAVSHGDARGMPSSEDRGLLECRL